MFKSRITLEFRRADALYRYLNPILYLWAKGEPCTLVGKENSLVRKLELEEALRMVEKYLDNPEDYFRDLEKD